MADLSRSIYLRSLNNPKIATTLVQVYRNCALLNWMECFSLCKSRVLAAPWYLFSSCRHWQRQEMSGTLVPFRVSPHYFLHSECTEAAKYWYQSSVYWGNLIFQNSSLSFDSFQESHFVTRGNSDSFWGARIRYGSLSALLRQTNGF